MTPAGWIIAVSAAVVLFWWKRARPTESRLMQTLRAGAVVIAAGGAAVVVERALAVEVVVTPKDPRTMNAAHSPDELQRIYDRAHEEEGT